MSLIIHYNTAKIATCFTPGGSCTEQIANIINQALKDVLVQAYSFSSAPIVEALVAAKKRNVDVIVILDKSQAKQHYSSSQFLANLGWSDIKSE